MANKKNQQNRKLSAKKRKGNRPDFTTERGIAKRWREGRGQGEGSKYVPWLFIREFASLGYRTITFSHKFRRPIHLFSTIEWWVFLLLEARMDITSLKEQFPLDRSVTQEIAATLEIRHPCSYGTDVVMTTDFLIEVHTEAGIVKIAIAVKRFRDLRKLRVVEKLQIEQAYHAANGTQFIIMTERDVPRELVDNLVFVRAMLRPGSMMDIPPTVLADADQVMREQLGNIAWAPMCLACDATLQLKPGTAARIARYLIATNAWPVDLGHPLISRTPFRLLSHENE